MKIFLYQKKKYLFLIAFFGALFAVLAARLCYIMLPLSEKYSSRAKNIEQREREIKAARGRILDRNGVVLADNKSVCTISVIYRQIDDPEAVIALLAKALDMDSEEIRQKVERESSREIIKSNVDKAVGDKIRRADLSGIKVDEDYKRYYPYDSLASKVLGFTGGDNQGIIGLEAKYDNLLKGENGTILTFTDYMGIEIENLAEERVEPVNGNDLTLSLDYNIQTCCVQAAWKVMKEKNAQSVSVVIMNPNNGEIYAMVHLPEYDLNHPYEMDSVWEIKGMSENDRLNNMWRNKIVSDSYEPGSTFKIITATAALEEGKVTVDDVFHCPGYKLVEDRRIRCHKTAGHGTQTFAEGVMNSCNPVFMEIGARVGAEKMLQYYKKLGLYEVSGIDLPGEAGSIMHPLQQIGSVELATMSFGQSIQITPLQLLRAVSAVINGGYLVTPHLATSVTDARTGKKESFSYQRKGGAVSEEVSETVKNLLERVVSEGTGKNAQVEGWRVGGKTATSEKLPRGTGKYISSFIGFAPADDPAVVGLILIDEPEGVYYGGTIAAPVIGSIFNNILPYIQEGNAEQ